MFNPFKNLFTKKSSSVVGIDIGSSSIKIIQLTKHEGKAVLETYGELSLGPYGNVEIGRATNLPPEKISEALHDIIRESKISTTNSGIAIPFGASLISLVEMPAVAEKQLAQMIPLEARKYIPVPISEVTLDWWVVPKASNKAIEFASEEEKVAHEGKIDVLLVAIHNDALNRYQTVVNQASLQTSFFELEVFSTIRAVLDQDVTTQMVVDIGAASTKIYIVEKGIIKTSHIINRGAQDITLALSKSLGISVQDAEIVKRDIAQIPDVHQKEIEQIVALTLDYVLSEANRVLLTYQKRNNKDISKVVLVGGGSHVKNMLPIAEAHFQTAVALGDPFSKIETPAFLQDVVKNSGPEFAVAVGIALRKLQENE